MAPPASTASPTIAANGVLPNATQNFTGLDLILHGAWSRLELICLGALGLAATQVMGFAFVGAVWWLRRR